MRRQRLLVAEAALSLTGAAADTRAALHPAEIAEVARHIANTLGANLGVPQLSPRTKAFGDAAARALAAAKGRALVLAGEEQPPAVHALCHWINARLGGAGRCVSLPAILWRRTMPRSFRR